VIIKQRDAQSKQSAMNKLAQYDVGGIAIVTIKQRDAQSKQSAMNKFHSHLIANMQY